jgi:hypothetical protein
MHPQFHRIDSYVVAQGIVDAAEKHLSPPAELGLCWARSHHQYWGWLLWFDWLWRCGQEETEEPQVPPAGMDLPPFSTSADLIARWGLDGKAGNVPAWLAELVMDRRGAGRKGSGDPAVGGSTHQECETRHKKRSTVKGEAQEKLKAALTKHHKYQDGGCLNLEPIGSNELGRQADVSKNSASRFFKTKFKGHTAYKRLCKDQSALAASLKSLNEGFAPWELFGSDPDKDTSDDDDE